MILQLKSLLILFAIFLCLCGCKKYDVDVNKNSIVEVPGYFSGTIDGKKYVWKADSASFADTSYLHNRIPSVGDSSYNIYASQLMQRNKEFGIRIYRGELGYVGNSPSQFDFRNAFLAGRYPYLRQGLLHPFGFAVDYFDGTATWTSYSTIPQNNFQIVSSADGTNARGEYIVNVEFRFDCALFNGPNGASTKYLTGGVYKGSFVYR